MGLKQDEIQLSIQEGAWVGLLWAARALFLAGFGFRSFPSPGSEGLGGL